MFGVNWSDPQTLWLNVVNLGLGLVTLVCIAAIGYGMLQDLRERAKKRAAARISNREVADLVSGFGDHAFDMPGLGLTMADGGEPLKGSVAPPAKTLQRPRARMASDGERCSRHALPIPQRIAGPLVPPLLGSKADSAGRAGRC